MNPSVTNLGYDKMVFLDFDNSSDIHLYEIGFYKCVPNYAYGPTLRPRDIVHFVISGKGKLYIDDKIFEISAGQAFLIPSGISAYYEADKEDPWSYIWVHIGGAKLDEIFYRIGLDVHQPVFTFASGIEVAEDILNEIYDNHEYELFCIGKLYELFSHMTRNTQMITTRDINPQLAYVRKTIKYIQLKYSEPIKIEDIAFACHLNRSYLSRLFKEATGQSIKHYLINYRMKMAASLLDEKDYPINYVALSVGYTDIFNFSKAFKKYFKVAPSKYKNSRNQ